MPSTTTSILILGDADFTYALDLVRYLATWVDSTITRSNPSGVEVVATAYDGKGVTKYKDLGSTLGKIERIVGASSSASISSSSSSLDSSSSSSSSSKKRKKNQGSPPQTTTFVRPVTCSIMHGVNALSLHDSSSCSSSMLLKSKDFDRIIFNHPHLGTEDMHCHARFLGHLFYSISRGLGERAGVRTNSTTNSKKKVPTVLHLVFAGNGQADRWRAVEMAALKSSEPFTLVDRRPFVPPPTTREYGTTGSCAAAYSSHRRGQSGKAFKVKGSSECLSFVLKCELDDFCGDGGRGIVNGDDYALPWMRDGADKGEGGDELSKGFECKGCGRQFAENRSLKNHTQTCRANDNGDRTTTPSNNAVGVKLICDKCDDGKVFVDEYALKQHVLQKHCGVEAAKPHWYNPNSSSSSSSSSSSPKATTTTTTAEDFGGGGCEICGFSYSPEFTQGMHAKEFDLEAVVPSSSGGDGGGEHLNCGKCGKGFRELRALTQHKNSCYQVLK
jgi:hypothetical protein